MKPHPCTNVFGAAALSLCFLTSLACASNRADTVPPGAERGGAGADGNNSAPESLSNGGPDPDTTSLTEPSTAQPAMPAPDPSNPPVSAKLSP